MDYFDGKRILDRYHIKSAESRYVASKDEAAEFASGGAIVLKLISSKALHKSKAGLVKLGLKGNQIPRAYSELLIKGASLKPYKIIAQKMSEPGIEIILGGKTDEQFGKMILIGLGGIYVEAFRDFAIRSVPITKYDATAMIDQLRSRDVITHQGKNRKMIENLLMSMSALLQANESITEVDLNPIVVHEGSYEAVDIRILKT